MSVSHQKIARVLVDHGRLRPTFTIPALAASVPLFILGGGAFRDLCTELHGAEPAVRWLLALSTRLGKPIGVNVPDGNGEGSSQTGFIAPRTWSTERLAGWIAGHHEELEEAFGQVGSIFDPNEPAQP